VATSRIADSIGRVLGGRYRLLAPIGTGASAHVYLAEDAVLRRRIAVKVLHAALADDESFLRRFRAEAQNAAALHHPGIMAVHDWGEDEDGPYLVLEHLAGGSLRDLLDRGHRLSLSQALLVGLEAARALEHAHRRGFVHRDIKPANLLFDDEGRLAIADFGLARALAEAAWTEPSGAMLGTARYASPEQARGGSLDGKADVYSLAIVMIEAVTGRVPFAADTTLATLMARIDRPLEVPAALGPLVPVLERAGHPDPAQRLDAHGFARALDKAATSLPRPEPLPLGDDAPTIDLRAASVLADDEITQLGTAPVPPAPSPPAPVPPTASAKRRWLRAVVAVLLALAVLLGGGYAVAQSRIPSHDVPVLRGKTVAEARRLVADDELKVRVSREVFDEVAPVGTIVDQDPSSGELKEGRSIAVQVSKGPEPRAVPDLAGLDQASAERVLRDRGFTAAFQTTFSNEVAKGTVLDWAPRQGRQPKGSTVTVTLSGGPEPKPVPSFLDRLYDEYRGLLEGLGLVPKRVEAFSDTVEKGKVIETRPAAGSGAQPGSEVTVVVSKGPETVQVPSVSGMTVTEAEERLNAVGLRVGQVKGSPSRLVVSSEPRAGTEVKKNSSVTLVTR
jgi:eukaryotic-like serine/threonine-protein kinase